MREILGAFVFWAAVIWAVVYGRDIVLGLLP